MRFESKPGSAHELRPRRGTEATESRRRAVARRDGPRERLFSSGPRALADVELVALLLGSGGPGGGAADLAKRLLASCGGLLQLGQTDVHVLRGHGGLGPAKAAALVAAVELGRRLQSRRLEPGARIHGPGDVHAHFQPWLAAADTEQFHAVLLDGRHRVKDVVLVSQGTLTASLVHPREVFRSAIRRAAAAIVLVHNHPSGDPAPSGEDRRVTERLVQAGELVGIRVLDHVVVAEGGFHSFSEAGEL